MQTPFHLHGKTIFVTGASSGIGRSVAIEVSRMGGKVVITGRNAQALNETFQSLEGSGHSQTVADLMNEEQRRQLVNALPALDGFVHCAGVMNPFPIRFIDEKKLDETLKVNFGVPVWLMSDFMRGKKLNTDASVVFISSASAHYPYKGGALYCSSKAALETFAKVASLEMTAQRVRCNCISPAMVQTPMYDKAEQGMTKEAMDAYIAKYPLGPGKPEDVAHAAIFLLSGASRWVTGANLLLDGGLLMGS